MTNSLDRELLAVLACPEDKGELLLIPHEGLYNPRLKRLYPIVNGIPVLLIDKARVVSDDEHNTFLSVVEQ